MNKCISCGVSLPPLNGSEENDFAVECEHCEAHEEETDDYECEYCGGDHSSFLCKHITRFDDMDCFKCGETFFFRDGSCSACGNKQY